MGELNNGMVSVKVKTQWKEIITTIKHQMLQFRREIRHDFYPPRAAVKKIAQISKLNKQR